MELFFGRRSVEEGISGTGSLFSWIRANSIKACIELSKTSTNAGQPNNITDVEGMIFNTNVNAELLQLLFKNGQKIQLPFQISMASRDIVCVPSTGGKGIIRIMIL